ncbi:hypothetical protein M9H77_29864 [Catharanthus roseus]|uniref:Uncharacterized protein n=1 Tax=Catharanthus roseus TaxID=4058 RepID=A0ACB9ZVL5_CATRO|nr:hypothetical protein M9H77_29864 [Catharanthus roseus]
MDPFEDCLQENVGFEGHFRPDGRKKGNFRPSRQNFNNIIAQTGENLFSNEDPNTFEEFLELEEYIDHGHLFTIDRIFNSKDELVDWAKQSAMKANTYLIITRYQKSRTSYHRPHVTLACECGGVVRKNTKPIVDGKKEEVPIKRRGPYGRKKCGCPFKLNGEQMATSEN